MARFEEVTAGKLRKGDGEIVRVRGNCIEASSELVQLEEALVWAVANKYFAKILWACYRAISVLQKPSTSDDQWAYWAAVLQDASDTTSDAELQMLLRYQRNECAGAWSEAREAAAESHEFNPARN